MADADPGSKPGLPIRRYAAAGGVVVSHGQVLLLDRPQRGEVRLPKGHIEPGEDPAQTARRETTEETGYAVLKIVAELGSISNRFTTSEAAYERQETFYLLRLLGEEQSNRPENDQAQFQPRWAPLADAVEQLTFESEREFVRRAIPVARAYGLA